MCGKVCTKRKLRDIKDKKHKKKIKIEKREIGR
jgi:hypothetical protein